MRRDAIQEKLASLGTAGSGVLVETARGEICKIVDGKEVPVDYELHLIDDIVMVNNSIVIRINSLGV